jgi:hypothetical protein
MQRRSAASSARCWRSYSGTWTWTSSRCPRTGTRRSWGDTSSAGPSCSTARRTAYVARLTTTRSGCGGCDPARRWPWRKRRSAACDRATSTHGCFRVERGHRHRTPPCRRSAKLEHARQFHSMTFVEAVRVSIVAIKSARRGPCMEDCKRRSSRCRAATSRAVPSEKH